MAPQDFPLRSDGPTVKAGNYPFKLDPLNISILGEMPVLPIFLWIPLCCALSTCSYQYQLLPPESVWQDTT